MDQENQSSYSRYADKQPGGTSHRDSSHRNSTREGYRTSDTSTLDTSSRQTSKRSSQTGSSSASYFSRIMIPILVIIAVLVIGILYLFISGSGSLSGLFSSFSSSSDSGSSSQNGTLSGSDTAGMEILTEDSTEGIGSSASGSDADTLPNGISDDDGTSAGDVLTDFSPHAVESTQPDNLIAYTEIEYNGEILPVDNSAGAAAPDIETWYNMDFGDGSSYTDVEGVVTFRGNNFRSDPSYGTAFIANHSITSLWQQQTGALTYNGSTWTGSGWTGQPLLQKWPRAVKQHMNMYDFAKEDDDLVEVIYACMDGYIYFLDLVSGQQTRQPLYVGYTFKGSGALDPRGYPLLYVGAGYDSSAGRARVFVISLIDGSILYTFGNEDSFSLRGNLSYFDSSPLVDADSDTLIYPGENGILYLIHLGTSWDESTGSLSITPDNTLKWRYSGRRTTASSFWWGMEDSCAVYGGYLYVAENGGHLMCLDLNTMQLVWVQDILDDSNSSPVLSIENGKLYLYISTSFRLGWRSSSTATVPIWKFDAETGEIIWQKDYECYTQDGVSGGVQSTIALGQHALSDRLYVTVSMVGSRYNGVLACLDKETGNVQWENSSTYSWSSPVCVYDEEGNGEIIYANSNGNVYVVDADTGENLSYITISDGVLEASPAVYDSYLVIGTRACKIWGLQLG